MGIQLGSEFDVIVAQPIDSRYVVADLTARDAIPAGTRYPGMIVYVESESQHFALIGGLTNGDWGPVAGAPPEAENVSYDNATSGLAATDVQEAIDELADRPEDGGGGKNYFDPESADFEGGTVGVWDVKKERFRRPYENSTFSSWTGLGSTISTGNLTFDGDRVLRVACALGNNLSSTHDATIELKQGATIIESLTIPNANIPTTLNTTPLVYEFPDTGLLTGTYTIELNQVGGSGNIFAAVESVTNNPFNGFVDTFQQTAATALSVDVDDTDPIAGEWSLEVNKSADNGEDDMAFAELKPIDRGDRGKTVFASVQVDATDSSYVSGDLRVEAWDVTNTVPSKLYTGPNPLKVLKTQGRIDFPVNLESTTELVEFRFVVNNDNTNAYTVLADEFRLGPAAQVSTAFRRQVEIDLASDANFT